MSFELTTINKVDYGYEPSLYTENMMQTLLLKDVWRKVEGLRQTWSSNCYRFLLHK